MSSITFQKKNLAYAAYIGTSPINRTCNSTEPSTHFLQKKVADDLKVVHFQSYPLQSQFTSPKMG